MIFVYIWLALSILIPGWVWYTLWRNRKPRHFRLKLQVATVVYIIFTIAAIVALSLE